MALSATARERLGVFPTPLVEDTAFAEVLCVDSLLVKRDDLSGFSWGGNKVRPAEYFLGAARATGATDLVVCGGPTSNFAVIMAAAGRRAGVAVHQVSYGTAPTNPPAPLRAVRSTGASIHFTGSADRATMEPYADELARSIDGRGGRSIVVPRGGASPLGSIGFVDAAAELQRQLHDREDGNIVIAMPVGSGGSLSGLVAGMALLDVDWKIVGLSVSRSVDDVIGALPGRALEILDAIGADADVDRRLERVEVVDCRGAGFGVETDEDVAFGREAAARTGLVFDPVYNTKALRWLATAHEPPIGSTTIYWLTGGALNAIPDQ